jgi:hypothetical protein
MTLDKSSNTALLRTYQNWMSEGNRYSSLPPSEMLLPGANNACLDNNEGASNPGYPCHQDKVLFHQLSAGIRVFDFSLHFVADAPESWRFQILRAGAAPRSLVVDVLDALAAFRQGDRAREIVILSFRELIGFSPEAHLDLIGLLLRKLGASLIEQALHVLPLEHLWQLGRNTIVCGSFSSRPEVFWAPLQRFEPTVRDPQFSQLRDVVSRVMAAPTKLANVLRSIELVGMHPQARHATDYTVYIDEIFGSNPTGDERLAACHIINSDWSTRSNLRDRILEANDARVRSYPAPLTYSPRNTGQQEVIPVSAHSLFYKMSDGDWLPDVRLEHQLQGPSLLVVHSRATLDFGLGIPRSGGFLRLVLRHGEQVSMKLVAGTWISSAVFSPLAMGSVIPSPGRDSSSKIVTIELRDGDWLDTVYLPERSLDGAMIIVRSAATLRFTIASDHVADWRTIELDRNMECIYQFDAAQSRWRIISLV